jgi:hypothetical protein
MIYSKRLSDTALAQEPLARAFNFLKSLVVCDTALPLLVEARAKATKKVRR